MNLDLVATFQTVAADLMTQFGRPVTHTNSESDESTIQAVIQQQTDALTGAEPWPQTEWTAQVATATGVARGDTLTYAGVVTPDDRYPDDIVWQVADILSDDGFTRTLAIRRAP